MLPHWQSAVSTQKPMSNQLKTLRKDTRGIFLAISQKFNFEELFWLFRFSRTCPNATPLFKSTTAMWSAAASLARPAANDRQSICRRHHTLPFPNEPEHTTVRLIAQKPSQKLKTDQNSTFWSVCSEHGRRPVLYRCTIILPLLTGHVAVHFARYSFPPKPISKFCALPL